MIGLESLRWILTLAFGGAAAFHLVRWLRRAEPRHEDALHLLMGLSMIVMIWPWGDAVPESAWITMFTLSAGWFLARAVASARRMVPLFFASAMSAMVWMSAAAPTGGHAHLHPMGRNWVSAGLGGYLVAASVWWLVRGMRLGRLSPTGADLRPVDWPALCHGTMSAGMGLALLAMA
ncbi:DUF5134 domain-containing protein [Paractinoplanes durhamensis]|uniref:DUF5134 domain-containing protein n=1 Tax=Paractinoplanes durhamensis TaxID=113563 RepID=A0ABQ3YZV9_9ACTN|nr:DUF5134 domain-containing protein [Actinoplanes durhamensis]GIE03124.1 DUF5134 domain-containing protein [Actinoplanes durhamensis]